MQRSAKPSEYPSCCDSHAGLAPPTSAIILSHRERLGSPLRSTSRALPIASRVNLISSSVGIRRRSPRAEDGAGPSLMTEHRLASCVPNRYPRVSPKRHREIDGESTQRPREFTLGHDRHSMPKGAPNGILGSSSGFDRRAWYYYGGQRSTIGKSWRRQRCRRNPIRRLPALAGLKRIGGRDGERTAAYRGRAPRMRRPSTSPLSACGGVSRSLQDNPAPRTGDAIRGWTGQRRR